MGKTISNDADRNRDFAGVVVVEDGAWLWNDIGSVELVVSVIRFVRLAVGDKDNGSSLRLSVAPANDVEVAVIT